MFRLSIELPEGSRRNSISIGNGEDCDIILSISQEFSEMLSNEEKALAYLVNSLFVYEGLLKDNKSSFYWERTKTILHGTEPIEIVMCLSENTELQRLQDLVKYTLAFSLNVFPDVRISRETGSGQTVDTMHNVIGVIDSVFLFSGGLDSIAGVANIISQGCKSKGIFVSHGSGQLTSLLEKRLIPFLKNMEVPICHVSVSRGSKGVQQLRGLLYFILGGLFARENGTNKLIVSEVVPTMYQPIYDILDEVTLTTHPTVIYLAKELFSVSFGFKLDVRLQFSNLTKSEALAQVPMESNLTKVLKSTNSCRNTMFVNHPETTHCGECLGCIIRRIAMILNGFEQPIERYYAWDILVKNVGEYGDGRGRKTKIERASLDNLLMILAFSKNLLTNNLDEMILAKIKDFDTSELFRRFSLEVMSVLHILYGPNGVGRNAYLKKFYEECFKIGIINEAVMQMRRREIIQKKYKPLPIANN